MANENSGLPPADNDRAESSNSSLYRRVEATSKLQTTSSGTVTHLVDGLHAVLVRLDQIFGQPRPPDIITANNHLCQFNKPTSMTPPLQIMLIRPGGKRTQSGDFLSPPNQRR